MIRSSIICMYNTRPDRLYTYLGVYSSKHRPNRLPPSSITFSFSLWIKAMTLRLHRRKWGWLHSNGNHTWFIYSIICPIYRFVSKLEPWFIWHCNFSNALQCQMRPKTGISPSYVQERCSNDNGTTSLPFSDRHNPNEAPRLPSPSHGDVARCVRKRFNFVGYGGARLIRDLGGVIST